MYSDVFVAKDREGHEGLVRGRTGGESSCFS